MSDLQRRIDEHLMRLRDRFPYLEDALAERGFVREGRTWVRGSGEFDIYCQHDSDERAVLLTVAEDTACGLKVHLTRYGCRGIEVVQEETVRPTLVEQHERIMATLKGWEVQ